MAFVTCGQFKTSQEAQDKAIDKVKNSAISAEDSLLDKTSGENGGKVTVEKIKQALDGDIEIAVNHRQGLQGNGKKSEPLSLKAKEGDFKFNTENGQLELGDDAVKLDKLGDGLKQDPKTGKIFVDAKEAHGIKANQDGSVGLALSKQKGNLLELRQDGIYYGIEPPADTSHLYVSSSQGDDKAKGTREAPLRTINEAFKRNRANQHFTIHLLETDIHEWRTSWGQKNNYTYSVQPYGAVADQVMADNPVNSYEWVRSKELKRPVIEFVFDKLSYGELQTLVQAQFGDNPVIFNGIRFRKRQQETGTISYGVFGGATDSINIIFRGCEFDLSGVSHYLHIGKPMSPIIFDHSKLKGDGTLGFIEGNGSMAVGFRAMYSNAAEGNKIGGLNQAGVENALTYNGYTDEQTIISHFRGNTTVMRAGIIY